MKRKQMWIAILLATGCASNGSGTVSGTFNGTPLTVTTALSSTSTVSGNQSSTVVLGNWANGCSLGPNSNPKNSAALVLVLTQGTTPVSAAGTFTIGATSGNIATVTFIGNDDKCVVTRAETGVSGSVVVTAVGDGLTGTFDVTMSNGDHVTGSFDAPNCAADNVSSPPATNKPAPSCV
jgi:hypothetical protein